MELNMNINLPNDVKYLLDKLHDAGFEAYVVGGCIRDSLLWRKPHDWDITTSAEPDNIKNVLSELHTVDTGIKYGTVTAFLNDSSYEVTTYRTDSDYLDNRHPDEVFFTKKLDEDLKRRDFTMNAVAYNEEDGFVDLFGGIEDLKNEIVRCVGVPEERFTEDALRMLRAVRFSAQLGFNVDKEVYKAICALKDRLKDVSMERINTEFVKILTSPHPEKVNALYMTGLLETFIPEFTDMMNTEQNNPWHKGNVGEHTIWAMQEIKPDKILRLTMFFHDVGKPYVVTCGEDGINHFYGHPKVSAEKTEEIMKRMKFDNYTISRVAGLVSVHDDRFSPVTEKAVRRAINRNGKENYPDLFSVIRADMMAQSDYQKEEKLKFLDEYEDMYNEIMEKENCFSLKDLSVNGKDLLNAGLKEGKAIGILLDRMFDAVVENPELNKKELLMNMFNDDIKDIIANEDKDTHPENEGADISDTYACL